MKQKSGLWQIKLAHHCRMTHIITIILIIITTFNMLQVTKAWTGELKSYRPFWTEKSSYVEGDILYCIGMATNAVSIEAGRQDSYRNGKTEVSNFAQLTDLSGLNIETQMTYEEENPDGTYNVFRLLKVNVGELTKWKTKLLAIAVEELEKQNKKVAIEIARKKEQVEILEQQATESANLESRALAIQQNIEELTQRVKRHIRCGMTMNEVQYILGKPRTVDSSYALTGTLFWNYGEKWLTFEHGVLVSIGINNKVLNEGWGCQQ